MYRVNAPDQMNWPGGLEMAYTFISIFPGECGYPNLGADITNNTEGQAYLNLDATESMGRISEGLAAADTAVVDFSLIYSWSNLGATLTESEISTIKDALDDAKALAATAAQQESTQCADAFQNGATSFTWPNGYVCTTEQCCSDYAPIYQAYVLRDELSKDGNPFSAVGIVADDIVKKHIYKFEPLGGNS